jgi:hypothetical protein
MTTEAKKCGHQSCHCRVEEGKIFCGPWCEGAKDHIEVMTCECGHPACAESMSERD